MSDVGQMQDVNGDDKDEDEVGGNAQEARLERHVLVETNARELWHWPCMNPPGTHCRRWHRGDHTLPPWHLGTRYRQVGTAGACGGPTHTRAPPLPQGVAHGNVARRSGGTLHGRTFACHGLFGREALCLSMPSPNLASRPLQPLGVFLSERRFCKLHPRVLHATKLH